MSRRPAVLLVLALLALIALPAGASANSRQTTFFEAPGAWTNPGERDRVLNEVRALGVDVVKIQIPWAGVAPPGATKPSGFNGRDPGAYGSRWNIYDSFVRAAQARGLQVHMAISAPAPNWATPNSRTNRESLITQPDTEEFKDFATAVGLRYSGFARDGAGRTVPRVKSWAIWNEPNLGSWLRPQVRRRIPYSPRLYRNLVRAGLAGLAGSTHRNDQVLIGDLAPFGKRNRSRAIPPAEFLREFFCLDRRLRPYKGRNASRRGCRGFRKISARRLGFAHHPYFLGSTPDRRTPLGDDAHIGFLGRITKVLDAAGRRRRVSPRRLGLYLTEFGVESQRRGRPHNRTRASLLLNQSEYIAFRNKRVRSFSQYLMTDDRAVGGFQTGLRYFGGDVKPIIYDAFRMPLYVRNSGRGRIEVFGAVRPAASGARATVQVKVGRRYRRFKSVRVRGAGSYFRFTARAGSNKKQFRLLWQSPGGETFTSRTASRSR